jgi:hypothetical protein
MSEVSVLAWDVGGGGGGGGVAWDPIHPRWNAGLGGEMSDGDSGLPVTHIYIYIHAPTLPQAEGGLISPPASRCDGAGCIEEGRGQCIRYRLVKFIPGDVCSAAFVTSSTLNPVTK